MNISASLTPTLIPRGWLVQGVLGGVVMGLGYLIGRFAIAIWRLLSIPEPTGRTKRILRWLTGIPASVILALCLWQAPAWQNSIRRRMGMDSVDRTSVFELIAVASAVFIALVLVGDALRWLFDRVRFRLSRYMPVRSANVAGFLVTVFLVITVTRDGVLDRVIAALDSSVTVAQQLFDTAPPSPGGDMMTGGNGSLVSWQALGKPGRDSVMNGPTSSQIAAFTGRDALTPIRVYVGLAQADTPQQRADIALAELIRQGGFQRTVLIVALPTGTGWLDPGAVDPVEYMHGGNIATVAVQYSYLRSPLALILETRPGLDQATALISTIHGYWRELPKSSRPRLYIHGLSLGGWSSMHGTNLFALLDDPINGAFWVGPPFPSTMWQGIVDSREPDSPAIAPILGDGRLVRFASHTKDAGGSNDWGTMRIVYLQYASDPNVLYEPASLFRAPAWMNEAPGPDVSPDMRFVPIITQFQLDRRRHQALNRPLRSRRPHGLRP